MASPLLFCHPLVRWRAPIGPLRLYIQRCSVPQPQLHFLKNHGRFTSISQTVFQAFDSRVRIHNLNSGGLFSKS
ncbi:hypothetical protein ACFX1R_018573 [Malus domestica]